MGNAQQKLIERLLRRPKDFRWTELQKLLKYFGYRKIEGDGSRVKFFLEKPRNVISLHKPHPETTMPEYVLKNVIANLKNIGVINGND